MSKPTQNTYDVEFFFKKKMPKQNILLKCPTFHLLLAQTKSYKILKEIFVPI